MKLRMLAAAALAMACAPVTASAVESILFQDNFDIDTTANYDRFDVDNDADAGAIDTRAMFSYDYSAYTYWRDDGSGGGTGNVGALIPVAPGGSAGRGLYLDVNNIDGASTTETAIINLYPKLQTFSGDYRLKVDMWMNYNGRFEGGGGSTEFMIAGINQAGGGIGGPTVGAGPFPLKTGYAVSIDGERGNGLDYRVYRDNTRLGTLDAEGGYVAQNEVIGTQTFNPGNGENSFYQSLFPYPGAETPGSPGKQWVQLEVSHVDDIVYYKLNGTIFSARTDTTVTSGNVMLGYADFISGATGVPAQLESGDGSITPVDANFVVYDNLKVTTADQIRQTWNSVGGGVWTDGTKWLNGVPNATDHVADFKSAISGASTVTVDGEKTVRSLVFNNANAYTIAGDKITIDGFTSGVLGTLQADGGSHVVSAPIQLNKDTRAKIAAGARLNLSGDVTANADLGITKSGDGTLEMKNVRMDRLTVNGGTVEITAEGGATGTSIVKSLTVGPAGLLHVNDNDLMVDYTGASQEVALRNLVKAVAEGGSSGIGFDAGGGNRVLAIAESTESGLADLNGIAFPDDTVVIGKYTYYGDANLDGQVTSDDYVAVDVGIGVGDSWVEGDFDFSGNVTSDDYVAIDVNLGEGAGNPLAFAELKAEMVALHTAMFGDSYVQKLAIAEAEGFAALVPEPGTLSLVGLGAAGLLGRRRRIA